MWHDIYNTWFELSKVLKKKKKNRKRKKNRILLFSLSSEVGKECYI